MLHSGAVVSEPGMFENGLDVFKKEETITGMVNICLLHINSCSLCLFPLAVVSELVPGDVIDGLEPR